MFDYSWYVSRTSETDVTIVIPVFRNRIFGATDDIQKELKYYKKMQKDCKVLDGSYLFRNVVMILEEVVIFRGKFYKPVVTERVNNVYHANLFVRFQSKRSTDTFMEMAEFMLPGLIVK